jgi:hypothetical protein
MQCAYAHVMIKLKLITLGNVRSAALNFSCICNDLRFWQWRAHCSDATCSGLIFCQVYYEENQFCISIVIGCFLRDMLALCQSRMLVYLPRHPSLKVN